jgi:hypothetical protein
MKRWLIVVALPLMLIACGGTDPAPVILDMTTIEAGTLPFGAPCTGNGDCASNICFMGGNRSFCSLHCTAATQATDCPVPPTSGTCNMQGFCKP